MGKWCIKRGSAGGRRCMKPTNQACCRSNSKLASRLPTLLAGRRPLPVAPQVWRRHPFEAVPADHAGRGAHVGLRGPHL